MWGTESFRSGAKLFRSRRCFGRAWTPSGGGVESSRGREVPHGLNVGEVGFLADFNVVDVALFVHEHGVGDGFHIDTFCEFWMKHERAGEGAVEVHFGSILPLAHVGVFLAGFHGKHRNPSFGDHLVVRIDGGLLQLNFCALISFFYIDYI